MKFSPRHLVWVNLVLLALVAYWGASTVSTAIAARLTLPPEVHVKPPPPPMARDPKRPVSYYASIQQRDIFHSAPEAVSAPAPPPPVITKPLNLKLWGVSINTDGNSHCIIEDLTAHKQDVYGVGSSVPGPATVKQIEWERVVLDRGGAEEVLELAQPGLPGGAAAPGGRPAPQVAAVPAPAPAPAPNPGGGNPHIQQVSDNEYNIDRAEIDQQLDNVNQLFTQIRAVPHFDGGKSTGFRLFAIRQGSVFDQIGLRNGDIIEQINNEDISDPQKALEMFQRLRNANLINLSILRNKESKNLTYSVK
jgi:general secretion pathway protein C